MRGFRPSVLVGFETILSTIFGWSLSPNYRGEVLIIASQEGKQVRDEVRIALEEAARTSPRPLRILDVGGGRNSWLGKLVTDVIDFNPDNASSSSVRVWIGDVHDDALWSRFQENEFDFVSCTHTLEDVRDPSRVVQNISRVGKGGFFATPTRIQETSHVESVTWLGNLHHRWIFHFAEGRYQAIAKWHYINPIAQSTIANFIVQLILPLCPKRLGEALGNTFPKIKTKFQRANSIYTFSKGEFDELSILWKDQVELIYANQDSAGDSPNESAKIMSRFLSLPFSTGTQVEGTWGQRARTLFSE